MTHVETGTMAERIGRHDWSSTPFGDRSGWQQSLSTIVDVMLASRFAMCIGWGDDVTLLYNDAYVQILGRKHPAALGRPLAAVWDDVWADIGPLVEQAMEGRSIAFDDLPLTMTRHGYAEETWWSFSYSPIRNDDGAIAGFLNVATETTGKKVAIRQLETLNETLERRVAKQVAEHNLLATLVETTDVIILACDLDYNLLAINKAAADEFEHIYGVRPAVGDNLLTLLVDQPEHQAQIRAGWGRGLAGEETTFVEDFGDPDRERPYFEIRFRTLSNEAGERIGAYQFVTDVTDRLREQALLAEAQEALRQTQKVEAMGNLTGGVAHDFNNLLTPIIGALDMLVRKGIGSERERRLIDGALQSAERAKTLVQRLLAFARRQPLQPTAVDVARVVEDMAGLIGSTLGPTIAMRLDLADLPPVRADANQLEMALLNLAVNARDAMPGGGTFTIAAMRESVRDGDRRGLDRGHYVHLSVRDTGLGMDAETRRRAIEPFFSTKGIGKGTGLGLSMVHGLAAQLGGGMTIVSEPGHGTSIELWLPISTAVPDDVEGAPPAMPESTGHGVALLVDDEDLVRMSTADMLVGFGFEVVEAGSADEALRLLNDGGKFDILVTDHLMPGMSGAELARASRALRPDLPVLVVSGYAEIDGIAPDLPRLTKPFRNAELAASLAALTPNMFA